MQLMQRRLDVGNHDRARGDDDVASGDRGPVVFPRQAQRFDIVVTEHGHIVEQPVEHALAEIKADDASQPIGERQADGSGATADVEQHVRAGKIHPVDELVGVAALAHPAAHLSSALVPSVRGLWSHVGGDVMAAIKAAEIDVGDIHSVVLY